MNHTSQLIETSTIPSSIEELGDPCKSILMYYYFDGMSMSDIAERMNFANTDMVGHTIGIRKTQNGYELFDPNFGRFYCKLNSFL